MAADALSDTQQYSVMDFAEWGKKQGVKGRHADVKSFLQEQLRSADGSPAPEPQGQPQGSRKDIEKDRRREGYSRLCKLQRQRD